MACELWGCLTVLYCCYFYRSLSLLSSHTYLCTKIDNVSFIFYGNYNNAFLWYVYYGVVCLYYIVAIFIGLYLYYLVIHTYAQKVIKLGLSVMEKIIMLIYQITIYPLTLLIRFLVKGVYRITIGKFIGI